jgi:hypothetical protein
MDLGSLGGGLGKMFDPGSLVSSAVKSFLPPDLQFLGGIAGAAVDIQSGNPMGAMQNGMDALQDLQQSNISHGNVAPHGSTPLTTWKAEPPPPKLQGSPSPTRTPPSQDAATTIGLRKPDQDAFRMDAYLSSVADLERRVYAAQTTTAPPSTAAPSSVPAAATASSSTPAVAAAPPSPPVAAAPAASSPTSVLSSVVSKLPAVALLQGILGSKAAVPADPSTMTKDQFMALGNDAFMAAVRDGKIPKEVQDSPAAMQSLQARMNSISQMNQLMTSMLQAMHQMQMSIIQNVRV